MGSRVQAPQLPSAPRLLPWPLLCLNLSLAFFVTLWSPNSQSLEVGRGCARIQGRSPPASRWPASPGDTAHYGLLPFILPHLPQQPRTL